MSEPAPDHAALIARLEPVVNRLRHMITRRHNAAHNGDIYEAGPIEGCTLCAEVLAEIKQAADALAALRGATPAQFDFFAREIRSAPPEATE